MKPLTALALTLFSATSLAAALDVEEQRLPVAEATLGNEVTQRYQNQVSALTLRYQTDGNELTVTNKVAEDGQALWRAAVADVQAGHLDDRSLYWARLSARKALKQNEPAFRMAEWQRTILLSTLEKASRGMSDIQFDDDSEIRILLTGFDPFLLDRDIAQSNPSGVVALALDGRRWTVNGRKVQVETAMIPVRFEDFDKGIVEALLTPYLRENKISLVATVSMGREQFDLERFPGRNRSATAPDNRNVLTGANAQNPLPPKLNGAPLNGPEFVEFSLPVASMQQAPGAFSIVDNHTVKTLNGVRDAANLASLTDQVSVEGSGGGYLSNEISYRSILLKELLGSRVPVGHIHTPKVSGHDAKTTEAILTQVQAMLNQAAQGL
ncbi:hypothetical protein [Ferrimonas balearica]|uniref:hypothetical protein n=1 Tax=Ferrimonas balearica TaxID=44012 RepID=UPI001C9A0D96|nr:hypothetical protein [Ferrimonas balearica]MBY5922984.1 hypothetical protein [Ferrimonas balearica]MBY5997639.1 hypothetical protein [Ferrimonas balearica]